MAKRDTWWDEAILGVAAVGLGAWIGQLIEGHPVIGAMAGGAVGTAIIALVRWRYIRPLTDSEKFNETLIRQIDQVQDKMRSAVARAESAEREVARARAARPALVIEGIRSVPTDINETMWLAVVRNMGESAIFTAKYTLRSNATERRVAAVIAIWGELTERPPRSRVSIANGDQGTIRLAMTGFTRGGRLDHPEEAPARFVRVVGSNEVDPIQPYSHIEGQMPKQPLCVLDLTIYATPGMEGGPLQRSFAVGLDGVKLLELGATGALTGSELAGSGPG